MQKRALDDDGRIFTIEALRGIAAFSVCWFHLTGAAEAPWLKASGSFGYLGVEVFFVISGFVIPYALHTTQYVTSDFPRFMLRRCVRLEPPFIASVFFTVFMFDFAWYSVLVRGEALTFDWYRFSAHFLYLIPLTDYKWLNGAYWTLPYEFVFYAMVGLMWAPLSRVNIGATAAAFLTLSLAYFLADKTLPPYAFLFLVGIAGMRYYVGLSSAFESAVVALMATAIIWHFKAPASAIAGLVTVLVILFVKIPRLRVLSFLGAISYSLYLVHMPIWKRVTIASKAYVDGPWAELGLALIVLALSLAVAVVFWRLIEAPCKAAAKKIEMKNGGPLVLSYPPVP